MDKGRIAAYGEMGLSIREIQKRVKGVGKSTIADILSRKKETAPKKRGRPPKITPREKRTVLKVIRENPREFYSDILHITGMEKKICRRSVNKIALEAGIREYKENSKGVLTDEQIKARYAWALKNRHHSKSYWEGDGARSGAIHFTMDGVLMGKGSDPERQRLAEKAGRFNKSLSQH